MIWGEKPLFSETSIYWLFLPLEENILIIEVSPSTNNEQCIIGPMGWLFDRMNNYPNYVGIIVINYVMVGRAPPRMRRAPGVVTLLSYNWWGGTLAINFG